MSRIELPENLLQQIEAAGLSGSAIDAFVQQAVREKFSAQRPASEVEQAIAEFDAICDEAAVSAPGTHLTRDQLQERA